MSTAVTQAIHPKSVQMNPNHASTPAVQMAAAVAAASMTAVLYVTMAGDGGGGNLNMQQHQQQPAVASVRESYRDPQLRAFEEYLLQNMRASDVTTDEEGVYLFNVNQVAYLVEGCTTNDEQRQTRRRVGHALPNLEHIIRRAPPSNKG
jgi:hypothetical protein